jgi:uncharacterized protein YaiI (UPF0178 family)
MKIWVDADACPGAIKELIIRTARRLKIPAVFVANKVIGIPDSAYVAAIRVGMGLEVVDEYIAENAEACDIVVTQDIPLASALVPKGVTVINPRGELYTEDNIRERLSIRNFMQVDWPMMCTRCSNVIFILQVNGSRHIGTVNPSFDRPICPDFKWLWPTSALGPDWPVNARTLSRPCSWPTRSSASHNELERSRDCMTGRLQQTGTTLESIPSVGSQL